MSLELSPTDNNYLQSSLVYKQLTQNADVLVLTTGNSTADAGNSPTLLLDGQGRGYLSGNVTITNVSPPAGMQLFAFPTNIPLLNDEAVFPVTVLTTGGLYQSNYLIISNGSSAVSSITVTAQGINYTSIPALEITGPGAGLVTTIHMTNSTATIATAQSGAGSYAPGNTLVASTGTGTAYQATVATTKVMSATIVAGGTGGTNGSQTVTGTTGTGTKFQANVTIAGGIITAVNSITLAGSYTVNPTTLTNEPVTGASLTGAALSVRMGVATFTQTNAGNYTVLPSNGATTTNGSGTGFIFAYTWKVLSVTVVNGGFGFTPSSVVTFFGGAGSGAAAMLVLVSSQNFPIAKLANAETDGNIIFLDGIVFFTGTY